MKLFTYFYLAKVIVSCCLGQAETSDIFGHITYTKVDQILMTNASYWWCHVLENKPE